MKTVVCRLDLGVTRIAGYTLFDSETKEFLETTPRETEKLVKAGCVNGLVFDKNGMLVPDAEGWNLPNMKIKSGVGKYRDFKPDSARGDLVYSVVGVVDTGDFGKVYEVVNNRCARVKYKENELLHLMESAWVGGVHVSDNIIEVYRGVIVDKVDGGVDEVTDNDKLESESSENPEENVGMKIFDLAPVDELITDLNQQSDSSEDCGGETSELVDPEVTAVTDGSMVEAEVTDDFNDTDIPETHDTKPIKDKKHKH